MKVRTSFPLSFGLIVLAVTLTFVLGRSCGNSGSARNWGVPPTAVVPVTTLEVIVAVEVDDNMVLVDAEEEAMLLGAEPGKTLGVGTAVTGVLSAELEAL